MKYSRRSRFRGRSRRRGRSRGRSTTYTVARGGIRL